MSNAEISAELFMSVATVKAHVSHVLTKLELNNRVQVALLVHDAGLAWGGADITPPAGAPPCGRPRPHRPGTAARHRPTASGTPRRAPAPPAPPATRIRRR